MPPPATPEGYRNHRIRVQSWWWPGRGRLPWLSVLVWLIAVLPLVQIIRLPDKYQWDFRLYYSAAVTDAKGYDPYDARMRKRVFPAPHMEFFYPPISLYLFQPLAALRFETAYVLWFGLKLLAFMLLLLIWHRAFEPLNPGYPMVLFFLLAYSGTLYRDLVAGNIALFEQLGLWIGFYFLLHRRYLLFGFCVACAAQFKILPLVFLGLLLLVEVRPRWFELGMALVTFFAALSLNFLLKPVRMHSFIARLSAGGGNLDERGVINPSILAFIRDGISLLSHGSYQPPLHADTLIYISAASGILLTFLSLFVSYRRKTSDIDLKLLIYAACLVFCVIAPRMKDYSYVLCLLPTLAILQRRKTAMVSIAAVCVFAPPVKTYVPFVETLSRYIYEYLPLIAAGMMLCWYLAEFRKPSLASQDAMCAQE